MISDSTPERGLCSDKVHLSAQGYTAMAKAYYQAFKKVYPNTIGPIRIGGDTMGTTIGKAAAARMLMQKDRIMIISHVNPDGDTLGSSFALYHALSTARQARLRSQ